MSPQEWLILQFCAINILESCYQTESRKAKHIGGNMLFWAVHSPPVFIPGEPDFLALVDN